MRRPINGSFVLCSAVVAGLLSVVAPVASAQVRSTTQVTSRPGAGVGQAARPKFSLVEQAVRDSFAQIRGFTKTDLITKSQVTAALSAVQAAGWKVPKQNEVLERVLADSDFLVQQLKTPTGRKLYRQIVGTNGAVNMLDRLRQMPNGQKTFETLVQKTPNTAQFIRELATTKRGRRFANDIAKFNGAQNFTKSTERIYHLDDLIKALREIYDSPPSTP